MKTALPNKARLLWFVFHGALIAAFLISLAVARPVHFNTSLFDILPPSHSLKSVAKADALLSATTSRAVTMLTYSADFASAKQAAEQLYAYCTDDAQEISRCFETISLFVNPSDTAALTAFLFAHRYQLLDPETIALLENGGAADFAEDALARAYGAFSLSDFSNLERDPFDISGTILLRFLGAAQTSGAMSIQDNVLAAQKDGMWYVLLRGVLRPEAASLNSKTAAVTYLHAAFQTITQSTAFAAPVHIAYSGVPFHSYESATSAQRQVSVISTLGIVLVILLFLGIFRSLLPALVSAGAVLFSCAMALLAVLLVFREIHILTFVFGTTLIGTCIDYSVHFFVHWKADPTVANGQAVRKKILRGIGISFASTEICFVALFLAPFPFLKQVSIFLFMGLLSAFLCVVCLYPYIPLPQKPRSLALPKLPRRLHTGKTVLRFVPLALALLAVALLARNRSSVRIDNNLRDMYTMSARLFAHEKTIAQVLDYGSSGWYFLVEGDSAENLLQTETRLAQKLAQAKTDGMLGNFLATSTFVPPQAQQAQSYAACAQFLPFAEAQFAALGFGSTEQERTLLKDSFYTAYAQSAAAFVSPGDELPAILQGVIKNLWLGNIGGTYYSCVLPLHTSDEAYFRALSADEPHVHFVNKVSDIGTELNALTAMMLTLLAGAFIVVSGILLFCYPLRTVVRIVALPLLVALVTISVLAAQHIALGFFSVTGLVLVFGLGLDYIIYAVEGEKSDSPLNNAAILISFATTALSFGALALISFAPVHTIGLTVFVGLTTACIGAFANVSQ